MNEFEYQKTGRYFAQVADGIMPLAVKELEELGASNIEESFRGIFFVADQPALYRINYRSRLCTRILAPLLRFNCHSTKYLYQTARKIDWTKFLSVDQTFAIHANVSNSHIRHSGYAALCLKDAIADTFREACGRRPDVDPKNPDLWINLFINGNKAAVNIDCSGGSLHRRGYRVESVEAPMMEHLAAAIIRASDWDGSAPLYDPFCGSGTLLCEAVMHWCRIPAAFKRKHFGFMQLPDYNAAGWDTVKQESDSMVRPLPEGLISGSDINPRAIHAALTNLAQLPGGENVDLKTADFRNLDGMKDLTMVCNPPYGIRLGNQEETAQLLKEFGDFLKQRCTGSTAFVYFGEVPMVKKLGLKPEWRMELKNAELDGRLCKYTLY